MGQQQSIAKQKPITPLQIKKIPSYEKTQYEGLIRCATTPFHNSKHVQIDGKEYFMENGRINLKELMKNRQRTNKRFSGEEIIKIIQDLMYTLAYLENMHKPYPHLCPQNAYFIDGSLKLMPPSVIRNNIYQLAKDSLKHKKQTYLPLSPEMLIGLRYREPEIKQEQILIKSNVFALGMLLLQICTMRPSKDCYDTQTYELLNSVITSRISYIERQYNEHIARIIANMLDYDFQERMTAKQFSIWINREIKTYNSSIESHEREENNEEVQEKVYCVQSRVEKFPKESPIIKVIQNEKDLKKSEIKEKITVQKQKIPVFPKQNLNKSMTKNKNKNQFKHNPYLKDYSGPSHFKYQEPKYKYSNFERQNSPRPLNYKNSKSKFQYDIVSPRPQIQASPKRQKVLPERSPMQTKYDYTPQLKRNYDEKVEQRSPLNHIYNKPAQKNEYNYDYNYIKQVEKERWGKNIDYERVYHQKQPYNKENDSIKKIKSEIEKSKRIIEQFRRQENRQDIF